MSYIYNKVFKPAHTGRGERSSKTARQNMEFSRRPLIRFCRAWQNFGVSSWGSPGPVVSILSHDLILDDLGAPAF